MKDKSTNKLSIIQLMEFSFSTGDVSVNFSQNVITRGGKTNVLQPKILELLVLLCSAQGETLTKKELIDALWPDTVVGPDSLANSMARLRKALGDDAKNPQFIETIQRKGYRWLQPAEISEASSTWLQQWPNKSKSITLLSIIIVISLMLFFPSFIENDEPEEFLFPDISIKKLADGGYEIEAGIEGELTEEKKAAMLKEIKRITGEENSGMEFTVDPKKKNCEHLSEKSNNECNKDQIKKK